MGLQSCGGGHGGARYGAPLRATSAHSSSDARPSRNRPGFRPKQRNPPLHSDFRSVYATLRRDLGVSTSTTLESIESSSTTAATAALLERPVSTGPLRAEYLGSDRFGTPMEYSINLFRTDRTRPQGRTGRKSARRNRHAERVIARSDRPPDPPGRTRPGRDHSTTVARTVAEAIPKTAAPSRWAVRDMVARPAVGSTERTTPSNVISAGPWVPMRTGLANCT